MKNLLLAITILSFTDKFPQDIEVLQDRFSSQRQRAKPKFN